MKKDFRISTLSIVCVLCAATISGAYGAPSVRSFSGAETTATAAKTPNVTTARAGSLRVAPTTARAVSTNKKTTSGSAAVSNRVSTSPRLSIGKYLGGSTAVSGGSSVRPGVGGGTGTSMTPDLSGVEDQIGQLAADIKSLQNQLADGVVSGAELDAAIDVLQGQIDAIDTVGMVTSAELDAAIADLRSEIPTDVVDSAALVGLQNSLAELQGRVQQAESALAAKQDKIVAGKYIQIVGDTVSVDTAKLMDELVATGSQVSISYDDVTRTLSWTIDGVPGVATINFDGVYETVEKVAAEDAKLQAQIDALVLRIDALDSAVAKNAADIADNAAAILNKADKAEIANLATKDEVSAVESQLANKVNAADVYTIGQTDSKISEAITQAKLDGSDVDLTPYAKTADVDSALSGKADVGVSYSKNESDARYAPVGDYATRTEIPVVPAAVSAFDNDAGYLTSGDLSAYAKTADVDSALAGKADTGVVEGLASTVSQNSVNITANAGAIADNAVAIAQNAANIASKASKDDIVNLATKDEVSAVETQLAGKADQSDLESVSSAVAQNATEIAKKANAADVYTTGQTDSKISEAIAQAKLDGSDVDLSAYATIESVDEKLEAKANSADLGVLATMDSVGEDQIDANAVTTAKIANGNVTKEKLADAVQASLDKADQALTANGSPVNGTHMLAVVDGETRWLEVVVE